MTTADFPNHTVETAPEESRNWLQAMIQRFGFVPSAGAKMAESPRLLDTFMRANIAFDTTQFTFIERKVIALVIAREYHCRYTVALHSALLAKGQAPAAIITALRDGTPLPNTRLEALRGFTLAVLRGRGVVPPDVANSFSAAGYTSEQALEVVLGLGVFTMSTLANRLTGVVVDPPFQQFRWDGPASPGQPAAPPGAD